MSERKRYRVTERAGLWVAGRKVRPGDILELSLQQAEYELMRGIICPVEATPNVQVIASSPSNMAISSAPRKRRRK
ncbi:Uncharacterised protein [Brucella anthropi]|nr:Uncharacterised protein [Brucella anthropi]